MTQYQHRGGEPETIVWQPDAMVEVTFPEADDFLKIKETLTRIGVASNRDKTLYQSCHILHKQGKYYIVHFKELFALDGKPANISVVDIERRNAIILLLAEWNLVTIVQPETVKVESNLKQFKIISYKDKSNWNLVPKYNIGVRH